MNHSQRLQINADEIKGIISDLKDKDKKEIVYKIASQMGVSERTAERYYKRFKPIEYASYELGENKKESACKITRAVSGEVEIIENLDDSEKKLELLDKCANILSKIKTY
tara:strand:- start:306 stop:635 length:330 start_codon:yes stop_codon:yes gene_type:complete